MQALEKELAVEITLQDLSTMAEPLPEEAEEVDQMAEESRRRARGHLTELQMEEESAAPRARRPTKFRRPSQQPE